MTCEKQASPEVIVLHLSPEDCPYCRPGPHTRPKDPRMLRLWKQLESKLLAHGGERAVWHHYGTTILKSLLQSSAQVFQYPVQMRPGRPNGCYVNASGLWLKDIEHTQIGLGFGLQRGVWRQHCWGLHNNTILETTVQQERYFGVALDEINALEFFKDTFLAEACRDWVKREFPQVVALEDRLYDANLEAEAEAKQQRSESKARRKKVKSTH